MIKLLAILLVGAFALLALVHVYWALAARATRSAALPEIDGRAAFVPSRMATLAVASALAACALLVAATSGLAPPLLPLRMLCGLMFALAIVLMARAIGDFRLVGFFKRVTGTRFARLDSAVYSPLCLVLAVATFVVGLSRYP